MSPDSSTNSPSTIGLDELEPLGRALLDLSLMRGMSDAEIAEVVGTDTDAVLESRIVVMRGVADQVAPGSVDADVQELEAIVAEHLYGVANGAEPWAPEPAPEAEPLKELHAPPLAEQHGPRAAPAHGRRSPLLKLLPLLLLGALIGVIVALANTGDDKPAGHPAAKSVRLAPIAGHSGRGTATIDGDKLRLTVSGLPSGAYEVWIYNSLADARRVGRVTPPASVLDARLAPNWGNYRYLDVSLEAPDGNANHSGASVLRAPLGR